MDKMKKNRNVILILLFVGIFIFGNMLYLWILPAFHEKKSKELQFLNFSFLLDDSLRGVVGIIPESEVDGLSSYNGIGSGVIFDKKDNVYYVVTAKHVIGVDNSQFKIFTKDTEFKGQTINASSDVHFEIPGKDYYESLLDAKVEYVSDINDLAILSFQYDGDLTVLEFESEKTKKNDRIMVIGHPEGNRYVVTYGYIKSETETIQLKNEDGEKTKEKVIKHNAYMKKGNSGGVALSKNGKVVGINIGGFFNILGYYDMGYMIPYDIVEDNINNWRRK